MLFARRRKGLVYEDPSKPGFERRIVNTLLLVLLFRLLANIPIANVDEDRLHELLARNPLLGAIDLFAGGDVLKSFSIVAVGLFPYLLAAGLVRLAARLIPALHRLEKDDEEERFKRVTRAVTLPVAVVLAWGVMRYLSLETGLFPAHLAWFTRSEFLSSLLIVSAVTFGSWLTETIKDAITKHGIGAGASVILLVGSSLSLITWLSDLVYGGAGKTEVLRLLLLNAAVGLVVIVLSIPLLTAIRNIPIMSAKRVVPPTARAAMMRAPPLVLPLKLDRGDTAPVSSALGFLLLFQIAAMALGWAFPGRLLSWQRWLLVPTDPARGWYWVLLGVLVIAFTYVTNFTVLWKPQNDSDESLAEALRKQGMFIPGIRPGGQTAQYLSRVMAQITLPAALTLAFLGAGLPYAILRFTGVNAAVVILAEVVFVHSFLDVRESFRTTRIITQPYEGLSRRRPAQSPPGPAAGEAESPGGVGPPPSIPGAR